MDPDLDRFTSRRSTVCASEGYPVSEVVAAQWRHAEGLFTDDGARAAYLFDGRARSVGQTVRLPDLGGTLFGATEPRKDGHVAPY